MASFSAVAPTSGGRENFSQTNRNGFPEERVVGRMKIHLDSLMNWSEPGKAPPAKVSQEPISKARLAVCSFKPYRSHSPLPGFGAGKPIWDC